MKFTLSANIKNLQLDDFHYIVTANARRVLGNIVADYHSGIHSFTMIGTYGTGKSSFLMALERDMSISTNLLFNNKGQFNGYKKFHFINIVGDYSALSYLLCDELDIDRSTTKDIFAQLDKTLKAHKKNNEFVLIAIDEFGKILEHAANHNPEQELYFVQQLAEFINHSSLDNVLLLTTLHQNFSAYAKKLTEQQKNEWIKVKGRFKEIVFSEPVEQLLHLAAEQITTSKREIVSEDNFDKLFQLAKTTRFINSDLDINIAKRLYPLDMFSAVALTYAIQRYGQNERSLFSFLMSKNDNSISNFKPSETRTYNLADVYDYVIYNFHSYLSEVNTDSANWRTIRVALERAEGLLDIEKIDAAVKIIKTIGLLNIFGTSSVIFNSDSLCAYSHIALNISKPEKIIKELESLKIIRYAKYKSQYFPFEGTDVNIEDELYKAAGQIPRPIDILFDLDIYFDYKIVPANAAYYKKGTPRFFEFKLSNQAITLVPSGDIDGYINLIFPNQSDCAEQLIEISGNSNDAIIYVLYKNVDKIVNHLYEIRKLEYILKHASIDESDIVAIKEINNLIVYEKDLLNKDINRSLTAFSENIEWYYKGKQKKITSQADFNKLLSRVCDDVYYSMPVIQNELFNRQKINSAISQARVNLLNLLIEDERIIQKDLGLDNDKFPPEKTIYYSLLRDTGIHRLVNDVYILGEPQTNALIDMWNVCEDFLKSSIEKQRKLGDLIKILDVAPFKLKQGFLDFWIPIYLIIRKQDYSLYNSEGIYIPNINREALDLFQKSLNDFKIKAFAVDGIKIEFFNQYRNFIDLNDKELITQDSFIETIKPFLAFYNKLNDYAKNTQNFDNPKTAKFRNVLAKATDPEKTFFEDLPAVFGFKNDYLDNNQEFMSQYQNLIKEAIRELRACYSNLIKRIEDNVVDVLGLQSDSFAEYKKEIDSRFKGIKQNLLSPKQRNFLNRVLFPQKDRTLWYESISFVVFDKPLTALKDNEEALLIDSIRHLFNALNKFIDVSKAANKILHAEIYNFELVSTQGTLKSQSYVLPDSQKNKTKDLEIKINEILSGDSNLDICTLLRILKTKIKNDG
ncbi:MAG: hypothetical protein LBL13_10015 [Bacteroidales bacterium]|jgi:hypothetical protein|nr:hypothetical protein [Bacteroidales bacterium]